MKDSNVFYANGGGDEQYTPENGIRILLPHIQHLRDKVIWLPFDKNDSQFVKVLSSEGFNVINSHIEYGQDFFEYEPLEWDILISNPPYKDKRKYIQRAFDFGKPFALLLPLNILSDNYINTLFKENNEDLQLLIPNKRMRFYNAITGETGNQPTFKASYFGRKIFNKQIILDNLL